MSTPPIRAQLRIAALTLLLMAALLGAALQWGWLEGVRTRLAQGNPAQPTVLFVVVDTARVDHLGLCGYERPTSPVLERLVADGAVFSCEGVAPGSWTLPSHASYFTGLTVPEHGSHFAAHRDEAIRGMHIRPLPEEIETLAEYWKDRGYQTAGLSGNPVLVEAAGVAQGFDQWQAAPLFGPWYGEGLVTELRRVLRGLEPSEPLFLFVNISDAHDPWTGIPGGLDWVPARDDSLHYFRTNDPAEWEHYVTGALSPEEEAAFRTRITDLYDWALYRADQTLGRVLEEVDAHGWNRAGMRLVVVSDHGEFLGEHQLARHGRYLWEPNQRVAVVVHDSSIHLSLPTGPLSALVTTELVRTGHVPSPLPPPRAAAYPDALWVERSGGVVGGSTSAAWWTPGGKWLWTDGEVAVFDLADDPAESQALPDLAPLPGFDAWVSEVRASGVRDMETDPALLEALKAGGYVGGE